MTIADNTPFPARDVNNILNRRVGAYATATLTVTDAVIATITWGSNVKDDPLQIVGSASTITIPETGLWSITATSTGGASTARSFIRIFVGGTILAYFPKYFNGGEDRITTMAVVPLNTNDQFLVECYYDLTSGTAATSAFLHLYKIGV